jgi:hypothetical protein
MHDLFSTKYRILSHVLFWVCVFGLFLFTTVIKGGNLESTIVLNLALLPIDMGGAYFTIYFLIPRYLFTRKYHIFFPAFLLFTLAYGILVVSPAEYLILTTYYGDDKWGSAWNFMPGRLLWTLVILLMINGLAASAKITKHWLMSQRRQHEIEKEKIQVELKLREAELRYLKAQIHPHFLFNTLNNLYGLTLQKSDLAPEVVVKLSEMLDFMFHEGNHQLIPLEREVKLLKNYIGLEKIRHDDHLHVELDIQKSLEGWQIAPFTLLTFVENAFKHGTGHQSLKSDIRLRLRLQNNKLFYTVENTFEDAIPETNGRVKEGLGLENLRKRLALQYNGNFELGLEHSGGLFRASLRLSLDREEQKP